MRKSPALQVEEISDDQNIDLATVEAAAARCVAADLAEIIKRLQADGVLIVENGRIVPNPERMQKA